MSERNFVIREVADPWKMRELEDVQIHAWGYAEREVLPATMFRISAVTGGIVLAAYPSDAAEGPDAPALGLAYGFPALRSGEMWHHSHLLATHPDWRGTGMAVALKLAQRQRALEQGLKRMTWTFDPLVARNARLNLGKLGARAVSYHSDWYALGEDRQTAFPADRLMIEWDLTQPHAPRSAPAPKGEVALQAGPDGLPTAANLDLHGPQLLAEVPTPELETPAKMAWRLALREVLSHYLGRGYAVTDLAREGQRAFYVLTKGV